MDTPGSREEKPTSEVADFGAQLLHSTFEKGGIGLRQIFTGEKYHEPESSKSLGGTLGNLAGTAIDVAVLNALPYGKTVGAIGRLLGRTEAAVPKLLNAAVEVPSISAATLKLGAVGTAYGGLLTPTESGSLADRPRNAALMGSSMAAMGASSAFLSSRGVFAQSTFRDRVLLNAVSGAPAGVSDTVLNAAFDGRPQDIVSSKLATNVASSVFFGGAFGAATHGLDVSVKQVSSATAKLYSPQAANAAIEAPPAALASPQAPAEASLSAPAATAARAEASSSSAAVESNALAEAGISERSPHYVQRQPFASLRGTQEVETVIVGGGNAGAVSFLGVAESGPGKIALVTKGTIASAEGGVAGSGNNLGMITTASDTYPQHLLQQLGASEYQRFIAGLRQGQSNIAGLANRIGETAHPHSSYWISYPWGEGIPAEMREAYMAADPLVRYHHEEAARDILTKVNPTLGAQVNQALEIGGEYSIDNPTRLALGIVREAMQRAGRGNAQVYENTPVLRFTTGRDGKIHLETENGKIIADRVIFATGNAEMLGGRIPVGEANRVYAMRADVVGKRPQIRHNIFDTEEPLNAFRIAPNGKLYFSSSDEPSTEPIHMPTEVLAAAQKLLGRVENPSYWVGEIKAGSLPKVGLVDKNIGFIGDFAGVGLAPSGLAYSEWRQLFRGQDSKWGDIFSPLRKS